MNKPPTLAAHSSYSFPHCCLETAEALKNGFELSHMRKKAKYARNTYVHFDVTLTERFLYWDDLKHQSV